MNNTDMNYEALMDIQSKPGNQESFDMMKALAEQFTKAGYVLQKIEEPEKKGFVPDKITHIQTENHFSVSPELKYMFSLLYELYQITNRVRLTVGIAKDNIESFKLLIKYIILNNEITDEDERYSSPVKAYELASKDLRDFMRSWK